MFNLDRVMPALCYVSQVLSWCKCLVLYVLNFHLYPIIILFDCWISLFDVGELNFNLVIQGMEESRCH